VLPEHDQPARVPASNPGFASRFAAKADVVATSTAAPATAAVATAMARDLDLFTALLSDGGTGHQASMNVNY
jgi:hypothetical protein